jgi:hypothetical protein
MSLTVLQKLCKLKTPSAAGNVMCWVSHHLVTACRCTTCLVYQNTYQHTTKIFNIPNHRSLLLLSLIDLVTWFQLEFYDNKPAGKQHEEYPSCIHRIMTSLTQWLLCTSQVFLCKILHLCSTPFFWTVARSLLDAFLFTTSWGEKTWKSPYLVDSRFLEV